MMPYSDALRSEARTLTDLYVAVLYACADKRSDESALRQHFMTTADAFRSLAVAEGLPDFSELSDRIRLARVIQSHRGQAGQLKEQQSQAASR